MRAFARHGLLLSLLLFAAAAPAAGQITVAGGGNREITLSGVVQPQFLALKTTGAQANDQLVFRRLFAQVLVAVNRNWAGDLQLDFGKSEVSVKNAYVQYRGWRGRGLLLTAGNQKPPFSRSFTTSGIKRTLAERPFTGDVHYGTLNRFLGVRLDGWTHDHHVQWAAALGAAIHPASETGLAFDSPANGDGTGNEGATVVGRLEWHPFGATPSEQGDFHTPAWRAVVGVAAYRWWNDGDRPAGAAADLGSSTAWSSAAGCAGTASRWTPSSSPCTRWRGPTWRRAGCSTAGRRGFARARSRGATWW